MSIEITLRWWKQWISIEATSTYTYLKKHLYLLLEPCQISIWIAREYACIDAHYYDLIPYWNNDFLCKWILGGIRLNAHWINLDFPRCSCELLYRWYTIEFGILYCIHFATSGDVSASHSSTMMSVVILILERASTVSVLPAIASIAPHVPGEEFDRIIFLLSLVMFALSLKVWATCAILRTLL